MADEVRSRAFEPFYTTKGLGKGTGLGLSMVYGFAKQCGGVAVIDSQLGHGSTVRLYLPIADASQRERELSEDERLDAGSPSRVLVIDDDDGVRAATVAMVRHFGHEVIEAESGTNGLAQLARDSRFDVMIVDLVMPNMHGMVFATQARALVPRLPAVFVTGYSDTHWLGTESRDQFLKKPFRRVDLADRLRKALGAATAGAAEPRAVDTGD
jgi:CheY-like chemotaxis protein